MEKYIQVFMFLFKKFDKERNTIATLQALSASSSQTPEVHQEKKESLRTMYEIFNTEPT